MARERTGEWMMWRVGRQRLAWRPVTRAAGPGYRYNPAGLREQETLDLLDWTGALLATVVVLPWRLVTNRWPVIAYVLNPFDGDGRQHRARPLPRAEAEALVLRWAADIERAGLPSQT
jgi:hypothetical protein